MLIGLPTARSHQLANTGHYFERNDAPPNAAPVDLRTVVTEFRSDGLYAISRNSPIREFLPGNGKFFRDPGKSSLVNIPNNDALKSLKLLKSCYRIFEFFGSLSRPGFI